MELAEARENTKEYKMELIGSSADALWAEALWKFEQNAVLENSRNGAVLTCPSPATITLTRPMYRVLYNSKRDANPFFHVMEFVWMMAGRRDVDWIRQFNKGIDKYAERDGHFHGAYGYRWQKTFGGNQIVALVNQIKADPYSRQHVLQMWSATHDLLNTEKVKDKPCNTSIMFRMVMDRLDMTVINRSNDLVWGALGANLVHMPLLHELIARSVPCKLGTYRVFSNNLHVYERHWELVKREFNTYPDEERELHKELTPMPLSEKPIAIEKWLLSAWNFCFGVTVNGFNDDWLNYVAYPMMMAYSQRHQRNAYISDIKCPAWRRAAELWSARHPVN